MSDILSKDDVLTLIEPGGFRLKSTIADLARQAGVPVHTMTERIMGAVVSGALEPTGEFLEYQIRPDFYSSFHADARRREASRVSREAQLRRFSRGGGGHTRGGAVFR